MEAIAIAAGEDVIAVFAHQIVAVDLIVGIRCEHVLVDQRVEMLRDPADMVVHQQLFNADPLDRAGKDRQGAHHHLLVGRQALA